MVYVVGLSLLAKLLTKRLSKINEENQKVDENIKKPKHYVKTSSKNSVIAKVAH